MAFSNIRESCDIAYGSNAKVEVSESDSDYSVKLVFPYDETII